MIELFHNSISTCSQKVRLCLAEKNLQWKSHHIDFHKREHLQPTYLRINPNGVVPTMLVDGRPVIESSVICEYIAEEFSQIGIRLIPKDPIIKGQMRSWLRYIDEVPTASIRIPSFNKLFLQSLNEFSEGEFADLSESMPLRKHFYQNMGQTGFSETELEQSIERLLQTIKRIDTAVSKCGWIVGDHITLADLCVLPIIVRMEDLKMGGLWQRFPRFTHWYERMKMRGSFSEAFYPGARITNEFSASSSADPKNHGTRR
jgi:glutathione S-transferase